MKVKESEERERKRVKARLKARVEEICKMFSQKSERVDYKRGT